MVAAGRSSSYPGMLVPGNPNLIVRSRSPGLGRVPVAVERNL